MIYSLGNWKFKLHTNTPDIDCINKKVTLLFKDFDEDPLSNPTKSHEIHNVLIGKRNQYNSFTLPAWLVDDHKSDWCNFQEYLGKTTPTKSQKNIMPSISWPVTSFCDYRRINDFDGASSHLFHVLLIDKINNHSHIYVFHYLLFLAGIWSIEQNGIILHSSAIEHNNQGFIFMGKSDSGKTTICKLSTFYGSTALGDDINYVMMDESRSFSLRAVPSPNLSPVGYSLKNPRLRGIFKLIKDSKEKIIPMTDVQVTQLLFEGFMQIPKNHALPMYAYKKAFHTISEISRKYPGYELHFRKSPDFWKVIDAEFPPIR